MRQYAESSATRITALKIKGPHLCSGPRPSPLSSLPSTAGWTVERANATLHRRGIASSLHCSVWKHGLVKSSSGHYRSENVPWACGGKYLRVPLDWHRATCWHINKSKRLLWSTSKYWKFNIGSRWQSLNWSAQSEHKSSFLSVHISSQPDHIQLPLNN